MEKILAKTLIALFLGVTIGLFSGYLKANTKYYRGNNEVPETYYRDRMKYLSEYDTERTLFNVKKEFNYKAGLLAGSTTTSFIIVLLLGYGLIKKTKKDE